MGSETKKPGVDRRSFLKGAIATTAVAASGCETDWAAFFQKHYKELSDADKKAIFERISKQSEEQYGKRVIVDDPQPIDGVSFAFAISLSACNGTRRCVVACVEVNNQSRDPAIQYIKVIELDTGSLNLEKGTA